MEKDFFEIVNNIDSAVRSAGIPIDGVAVDGQSYRIDYRPEATQEQREQAETIAQSML